jgi:CHAT domain-containing protein/tetratricopeptide (TPR) repeat protein
MDTDVFLQTLRDFSLEDGKRYIQEHVDEFLDYAVVGNLIKDEAQRQENIAPFISLKLAELLIFFGEYVHHSPSYGLGLLAKGMAFYRLGRHRAAIENLDASAEEFLRQGDEVCWARTRMCWILPAIWLGRAEEVLQVAAQSREIFLRYGENSRACMVDNNTAIAYTRLGRYQEAIALYEKLRLAYPNLTDQSETFVKRAIAMAENNQAMNLFWLGKFEEAYRLMEQAKESFIAVGEPSFIIYADMNLAWYDNILGHYSSALRRYYQARDSVIQYRVDDPMLVASLNYDMTECLVNLNRVQEACQLASEAVKTYRQFDISLNAGEALCRYAITLAASGQSEKALAALDEACSFFSRGRNDHYTFSAKLQRAELLLERGSAVEAYHQASSILGYFEGKGLVSFSIRASLVKAGALLMKAQGTESNEEKKQLLQEATLICRQVAMQAHKNKLQEQVYKSQHVLGQLAVAQGDSRKAIKHYGAAIAQVERILDDLVYDLSPSFLHTTWTVYEDMIALCLEQNMDERAFNYLEQARSMALRQYMNKSIMQQDRIVEESTALSSVSQTNSAFILRMQYELREWQERYRDYNVLLESIGDSDSLTKNREEIELELKQCEAKISELFDRLHLHRSDARYAFQTKRHPKSKTQLVNIEHIRHQLTSDQLLLAYFLCKGNLVIFAITTKGHFTFEIPDGAEHIERLLPLLLAHLQPEGWPNPQQPPQQAIRRMLNKLYDLLVAPVAALLPSRSGSLTIVPYGPLHKLPFHALYNGSRFLIEDFQINYLPASNMLPHFDPLNGNHSARSTDTYALSTSDQVDGLFRQRGELTKSSLVIGYSGMGYLQRTLDEARAVAALLGGSCYLEDEATIKRLIEEVKGSSIVHLATHGQSRLDAPNFSFVRLADGQLNAIDAFSLDMTGCELVTLSGCETGLALSGGGDEQLGLGRAFLAAGASSLVLSLWSVEDNSTNELMQLFYRFLLRGDGKAEALRNAQCNLIHQTSSLYSHPYFWAAFRLVGEIGPLKRYMKRRDQSYSHETGLLKM